MRTLSLLSLAGAAALTAIATPASATGAIKCQAGPASSWKTQDALEAKLVKEGWQCARPSPMAAATKSTAPRPKGIVWKPISIR